MRFLIISRHRRKHRILKCLLDYDNNNFDDPPYFGAIDPNSIKEDSKYYCGDIHNVFNSLSQTKDVYETHVEDNNHVTLYGVNDKGRNSYYENVYLNKIWWRSQKFWSILVPIFISLGALAVSIFSIYYDVPCAK
jgi:hypothetical protein